ncbi:HNH endonuclease signature motif containing protein [Ectopseudomonas chengduensis]
MASTSNAAKALRELSVMVAAIHQRMDSLEGRQRKQFWSAEEEQTLRDRYADELTEVLADELGRSVSKVLAKANLMGLHKSQAFIEQHCRNLDPETGAAFRFQKGHTTWNKGMKGWKAGGRSAETRFTKGQVNGRAAQLLQPIGAERTTKDGIRQRKVRDDGPPQQRWKSVHSIMWEERNGPIPKGHIVVFRDGNTTHIEHENFELITRAELMRRNTIHNYPPELKAVIRTVAKLKRTIREVEQDEEQN